MGNALHEKEKGDLHQHLVLVTGECSVLLWEEGEKVGLSCGCSKALVPGDVVWHRRVQLLPQCCLPSFTMGNILASFLPLLAMFGLRRGWDFSGTCSTWRKGNLALLLMN